MRDSNRSQSRVDPAQVDAYNRAQRMQELEGYRQQADEYWQRSREAEQQAEQFKAEAEQASTLVHQRNQENQTLIQRVLEAIKSRDSMRGRLGNMTAQRNRAVQQVNQVTAQNEEVMSQLKVTTDTLGNVYQQLDRLEANYDQDMMKLAVAYQEMGQEQRRYLTTKLRQLLDQIEQEYQVKS